MNTHDARSATLPKTPTPSPVMMLAASAMALTLCACGAFTPTTPSEDMSAPDDMTSLDMSADMSGEEMGDMGNPTREVGEICAAPSDCVEGTQCVSASGTYRCMSECVEVGNLCEGGEVCTSAGQAGAVCYLGGEIEPYASCQTNIQCARGHLCFGVMGDKYCLPACYGPEPTCSEGDLCVSGASGRGYCRGEVGRSCSRSDECEAGLTCSAQMSAAIRGHFVEGACTRECVEDADCGEGSVCREVEDGGEQVCVDECEADASCRFNLGESCYSPLECPASPDPDRCAALTKDASVCLIL